MNRRHFVAPIGNRLCRRLPTGDTADCQSALRGRSGSWSPCVTIFWDWRLSQSHRDLSIAPGNPESEGVGDVSRSTSASRFHRSVAAAK